MFNLLHYDHCIFIVSFANFNVKSNYSFTFDLFIYLYF